jgi:hypothetical protein
VNSSLIALLVLGATFGASMLAIQIRRLLPSHHIDSDSKEVLRLVVGLTSTLTALVLGLLISSAYSAYQLQRVEIQDLGIRFFEVDRILGDFGAEAAPQRSQLKQILVAVDHRIWPEGGGGSLPIPGESVQVQGEALFNAIAALPASTNAQHIALGRATQLLAEISGTWHLLLAQKGGSLSAPILWVLTCWLIFLFFGFGLFTKFNGTVATALFVGAAAVSAAIFLIVDLNQPYAGWMQLPKSALTRALADMGK